MKPDPLPRSEITGATNLMASKGLEHSYVKLTTKKMKDSLSSFLPNLPGVIDTPGSQDNSSLRGLIEKPPVVGKELHQLSYVQLAGFRLHPGPLPEQYRFSMQVPTKKKQKRRKTRNIAKEAMKLRHTKKLVVAVEVAWVVVEQVMTMIKKSGVRKSIKSTIRSV